MKTTRAIVTGFLVLLTGLTQPLTPTAAQPRADRPMTTADIAIRNKLNAWTVGLAGGLLEGAPIRLATEIARVVDEGDALHVLPIVTRGPAENVEALLYLRGVDAAIINADALEQFRTLIPNVDQRISYILNLFPSDLHIFVRPEIHSLADLNEHLVDEIEHFFISYNEIKGKSFRPLGRYGPERAARLVREAMRNVRKSRKAKAGTRKKSAGAQRR